MREIYLYGSCCISIQPTFRDEYFFEEISEYTENGIKVIDPDYKEFIPALQLRRMGKSMRMAVYASQKAIQNAGNPKIDAVITGTGEGCLRDSEKFVEAMWDDDGGLLNPTPFIQSTHNMAAATIALSLGCKGYNMTYTNNSNSFESAVLDAMLHLTENPGETILIGGLEEVSEQTQKFWNSIGYLNEENPQIPTDLKLISRGEIISEGTGFFVASNEQKESCLGKISALKTTFELGNPEEFILEFLQDNEISVNELDGIILGNNGDNRYDKIYQNLSESLFQNIPQIVYKNTLGEFDSITSLAVGIALKIFEHQQIPSVLKFNELEKENYQTILIYNQRRGQNHSLILIKK